ncbi:unnamed protein product [Linum trigynum]|uniref:Uncharacterized protein n=1 Tax=Linum trigynum TaxID=586398 RepID=A0AAV2FZD1_9ROSI
MVKSRILYEKITSTARYSRTAARWIGDPYATFLQESDNTVDEELQPGHGEIGNDLLIASTSPAGVSDEQ